MSFRSLRDFIAKLEIAGELVRVREPVSTVLEMTEIQTRLIAQGGPAGARHTQAAARASSPSSG